jgi:3'-phosphoadenosine 5'-phosphosulfate (PAPS) 3'-phosphatase
MAHFTIRVELQNAEAKDYVTLTEILAQFNITDTLMNETGLKYKMPQGEYQCHSDLSTTEIRDIAAGGARVTNKEFGVLVTQSDGARAWVGLPSA